MEDRVNAFVPGPRIRIPGRPGGPLSGLTFAVKDLFDVAGVPTGGGNHDWATAHPIPERHAWAVQALLDAGAELVGKTITDEVSLGILGENAFDGTPLNTAAPDRVPGGYRVSGSFHFGSGSREASWFLGAVVEYVDGKPNLGPEGLPVIKFAFTPRENVRLRGNWDVMGLQATGSHDLVVDDVLVPEEWTFVRGGASSLDTPLYRYPTLAFCSMRCRKAGVAIAKRNKGMIDKTARETQALKDARRPFAEALTELGLMEPFYHRTAVEIDRLIEAAVTGYVDSMQRQAATPERTGTALDDPIPF